MQPFVFTHFIKKGHLQTTSLSQHLIEVESIQLTSLGQCIPHSIFLTNSFSKSNPAQQVIIVYKQCSPVLST